MMRVTLVTVLSVALTLTNVEAQQRARANVPQDTAFRSPSRTLVRVSKWLTLGAAAGAAAWGVTSNREADRRYEDLERMCVTDPERCRRRTTGGAFTDAQLEQEYQAILDLDDRAKLALAAAEISVATSVVLFILDLPRNTRGEDIPYHPPRLEFGVDARSRLTLGYRIR
jgi:hypothetical protein